MSTPQTPVTPIAFAAAARHGHPFAGMTALVIDENPISRTALASVLRDIGIDHVKFAASIGLARTHLQTQAFDVILCEYNFTGAASGQDLLDEIRTTRMIPFHSVFFMVTGEATYERVAEVVENAPDDYLLKPFKPYALEERLTKALTRKRALAPIHRLMEGNRLDHAGTACRAMVERAGAYWIEAARVGAELALHHDDLNAAQAYYTQVLNARPAPWARLGQAYIAQARGEPAVSREILEQLVAENGAYAEACDMLARLYFEEGALEKALLTLRRAVEATPANVARLQKMGTLAFLIGDRHEAELMLSKAFRVGFGSRLFDLLTVAQLVLLATARNAPAKEIDRLTATLDNALAKSPDDLRVRVFELIGRTCALLPRRQPADVVECLRETAPLLREPGFDVECALLILSLYHRVGVREICLPETEQWVETVARRHGISKAATDLMVATLGDMKDLTAVVERQHVELTQQANEAMGWLLKGDADRTAARLTTLAGETLNARLFGLAESLATRYRAKLSEASLAAIEQSVASRRLYCKAGVQLAIARLHESSRPSRTLPLIDPAR